MEKIGELIKNKRIELGYSQQQMAEKLNVSQVIIGQYERGRQKPKPEFYKKWQKEFSEDLHKTNSLKQSLSIMDDKDRTMQVLLNISENNKMLSQAALKAVEGSNISAQVSLLHAQSISKLTDHSNDLMNLVKSTEHAAKESLLNDDEKLISALGRLVVKRMGVEWHSEEEAVSVLSRRVLESLERSGGSHAGVGK